MKKAMQIMFVIFAFCHMFVPLIAIPYLAYYLGSWFLLFGILFSFVGSICAARELPIIYLFTCLCIGFWLRYGFDIHQYITFYFFCSLWGHLTCLIAGEYENEMKKGS
jgi:hypothetical protein